MKKINLIVIVLSFMSVTSSFAQDIPIIEFADLEARINSESSNTVIYNFWATWCAPCVKELPEFEAVQKTGAEHNREVVLVSLDFAEHYETKLIPFVNEKELKSEIILLDAPNFNDWIPKVDENWSGAIPATLIINTEKNIRVFVGKKFGEGELEALLEKHGL